MSSQYHRILHSISSISREYGGPVTALKGLIQSQVKNGAQISVVATFKNESSDSSIEEELRDLGVSLSMVGPTRGKFQTHPALRKTLSQQIESADVVHTHGLWESIQYHSVREARRLGKPSVLRTCGMLDPWSLSNRNKFVKKAARLLWVNSTLRDASAIHFTTAEEEALAKPVIPPGKSIIEPNGLDVQDFDFLPGKGYLRSRLNLPSDSIVAIFLGRVAPKKGIDLSLSAVAKLGPGPVHFVIAGPDEDDHTAELVKLSRQLGLESRVHFVGPIYGQDKIAALTDADLFVLTSHQENFGNAVIEAMACATPVLISDRVNLYREIQESQTGFVTELTIEQIAETFKAALRDPKQLSEIGERSRTYALKHFDWNEIANRWMSHYSSLIENHR